MSYCLEIEAVVEINRTVTAGRTSVLQRGALESALGQPLQTFDGVDLYPTVVHKAAVLLRGVVAAHAFMDGNKRTAWIACVVFLDHSGLRVHDMAAGESGQFVLDVESGVLTVEGAALWLLDRLE
ncbi:type II toxin-antitoxin system death-on-curing family toxin [Geodermatophilus sp. DSM 45219]|uniref:type II toxin-antitoxin system death-on-curing family toxin n=1 Tax=Geodermatophilus sp. DSM 45219 TaxID=1881103 RepID=UPI00087E844C|nr:death on curing protein [Geodermatophilus sp. DSM 45219]